MLCFSLKNIFLHYSEKHSSVVQVQNQSISETTFGRVSDFIGSFAMFPKKDEPRGTRTLQFNLFSFFCKSRYSVLCLICRLILIKKKGFSTFIYSSVCNFRVHKIQPIYFLFARVHTVYVKLAVMCTFCSPFFYLPSFQKKKKTWKPYSK